MAEITATGYIQQTQNEWFADERTRYLAIDPNWNLDPSTPDGLKLATDAEIWGNLDELGLVAYNSKDPDRATGQDLDALLFLSGLARIQGSYSTVVLDLTGVSGTNVLQGSKVKDTNGAIWITNTLVVLSGGTVTVNATAEEIGAVTADANSITSIVTPISGWQSVDNSAPATTGTNTETDAIARNRRNASVANPGSNQSDSIYSTVANVDGVRWVSVEENDTESVDGNGLPAHNTAVIVDGGADDDIAQAIFQKKSTGAPLHQFGTPASGTAVSTVTGKSKLIPFGRPSYVDIAVVVEIQNDGSLDGTDTSPIKQSIIDYTSGTLFTCESGFNQTGFNIGQDVPAGRLYTPVNQYIGGRGNAYVSSLTVNGTALAAITFEELARFTTGNISVVYL